MSLKDYGVLKGRVLEGMEGRGDSNHYQVHVLAGKTHYRIAVNIKSKAYPSEVLYYIDEHANHQCLSNLNQLEVGYTPIRTSMNREYAIDYLRTDLFDISQMRQLPHDLPGPDNDLNEKVGRYIQKAVDEPNAFIYAFGERWGPESNKDKYFNFKPSNGIHDIHMNQGSSGRFSKDNGIWQDGGLFLYFPSESQWVTVFLAFQSQAQVTDDDGHPIQ